MTEARSRREFLLQAVALGAAAPLVPSLLRAADEIPARKYVRSENTDSDSTVNPWRCISRRMAALGLRSCRWT